MAAPDLFGILDVVKKLTAPAGLEAAHRDGFSWARNGLSYADSTKLTADDWNRITANLRMVLIGSGIDLETLDPTSPALLRDVMVAYIAAKIVEEFPGLFEDNKEEVASELAAIPAFVSAVITALPTNLVLKAGDTMTGPLVLPGDPASALQAATKQYVDATLAALVDAAPGTLDTLNELAAALADDPNFAATMTAALAGKISASLLTTQGDIIYRDGSGPQRLPKGLRGQALRMNAGATAPEWGGAGVANTVALSGTQVDFSAIPAGVRRIRVGFANLSVNAAATISLLIGTGGVPATSGYSGTVSNLAIDDVELLSVTTRIAVTGAQLADATVLHGMVELTLIDPATNTWLAMVHTGRTGAAQYYLAHIAVSLAGALDIVRLTTLEGTASFDAGTANLTYEF